MLTPLCVRRRAEARVAAGMRACLHACLRACMPACLRADSHGHAAHNATCCSQAWPLGATHAGTGPKPLSSLSDLRHHVLLHDLSRTAWKNWLKHVGVVGVNVNQGPVFSHSMLVLQAAALGQGIALGNTVLARPEIEAGRLVMPFEERVESRDAFYLVCEESQAELGKIAAFRDWILALVEAEQEDLL